MFVVVVYDISHDRRRTKLHDALLNFGTPVQYSVFECILDEKRLEKMKKAIMRVIKPRQDRVRFYYLCRNCVARTEVTSGPEVLHETEVIVV
ncbi:MAG: CRISPR-associated endonuclease Cas2 [Chloroflexota bacterium]|nr:CRISPR-associated endonuclease Cas2 [Chloroflexota bacterium]